MWTLAALALLTAVDAPGQSGLPLPPKPLKPDFERPAIPLPEEAFIPAPEPPPAALVSETPAMQEVAYPAQELPGFSAPETEPGVVTGEEPFLAADDTPPSPALLELQAQYEDSEASAAPAEAAPEVRPGIDTNLVIRGATGLVFICGLIIVLAWAARRFGGRTALLAGPSLGQVLGRVHLSTKVSLHYVRSGGRVLVIAVTPASASLITEFEASAFAQEQPGEPAGVQDATSKPKHSFAEHLRSRNQERATVGSAGPDDELAGLQGDIERLRNHLRDSARELEES
jgi:flagellar biogenesis protein FliO